MLSFQVIAKYALIHLAELAIMIIAFVVVMEFVNIPLLLVVIFLVLWVIKDIAMFFRVWKSYVTENSSPMLELVGLEAQVVESLDPVGYVRVRGELWKAELVDPRHPARLGERTRVVSGEGMTLIVEKCDERRESPGASD